MSVSDPTSVVAWDKMGLGALPLTSEARASRPPSVMRLRPAGGNQWTHIGSATESLLVYFPLDPEAYNFDELKILSIKQMFAYLSRLLSRP